MCVALMVSAQDIIITKSEKAINAIVKEVGKTEIKYVAADNVDGPLFVIGTDEVTSILYANGSTQVFEESQERQEVTVKHSDNGSAYAQRAKAKSFIYGFHLQYSGRNSKTTYNSKSDMSDIVSGFAFGADFTHSIKNSFLINYGLDIDLGFANGDCTAYMLFPIRFGYQHVSAISPRKKQYFRLMTGPVFDIILNNTNEHFNCVWDVRAEYQYHIYALYLGTAWGLRNQGNDSYKAFLNIPIYAGLAIKL